MKIPEKKDFTRFSVGIYLNPSSVTGGSIQSMILNIMVPESTIINKLIKNEIKYIFMVSNFNQNK